MRGCHLYIAGHQFQCGYGACDLTFPLRTMSLLNEAYRLRYTGESAGAAKKRKALAHLDETIERAETAFQAKRAKAETEFREEPHFVVERVDDGGEVLTFIQEYTPYTLRQWEAARDGTLVRLDPDQWLEERGLAPLSEEETPSLDTLVRRHVDETVGTEAVVPLTTKLLTSILTACK